MEGLPGSQPKAVTGDLQGAQLPRGRAAFRSEAAAAGPDCPAVLSGVLPLPASGGVSHPAASSTLACAPLAWLYSVGLLSKQLKLPFVHLFNGSPLHWSGTESTDLLSHEAENLQASDLLVLSQVFQQSQLCVGYTDTSVCLL